MKTITINKGWFRKAGEKYHWLIDGYSNLGVGIAMGKGYFDEPKLCVQVEGIKYILDTQEAKDFVMKYNSKFLIAGGTKLAVVSRSLLQPLTEV